MPSPMKTVFKFLHGMVQRLVRAMSGPADWFDTRVIYIPIGEYRVGLGSAIGSWIMGLSESLLEKSRGIR